MNVHTGTKGSQFALALATCCALSSTGYAQSDDERRADQDQGIEEVLVTARKIEESLQDIPLSISAFTSQDINDRSIEELEDIALLTPGLTFEDFSNGAFGTPVVRGASQFDIDALEQNVSTFIDGVYIPRQYAIDLGTVNLERLEVVKGPQSALYGANAFLGAINYVTRKADLEKFYADISAEFGNFGRQDFTAEVSVPLIVDRLAIKLNGTISEFDGDFDNDHPAADTFQGRGTDDDFSGWDNDAYGASIVAAPIDALRIELGYSRYESEVESRAQTRLSAFSGDLNCGALAFGVFSRVFCGELPNAPRAVGSTEEVDFALDPRSYTETETDLFRGSVAYDINENFSVSYQYSNIQTDIFSVGGADRNAITGTVPFGGTEPANFLSILPFGNFEHESHEVRFEFVADNGFYATLGYFGFQTDDFDDGNAGFPAPLFTESLTEINPADIPEATRNSNLITTDTDAIFARVSIPFASNTVILSLEGRYTDEEKTGSDPTGDFVFEDDYFTPRVSLDWRPNDNHLLFASFAQGVKSGGINGAVVTDANFALVPLSEEERFFAPDENDTYEVGLRSQFLDGSLQFNATFFLIDWDNLQVGTSADGATAFTSLITSNLGSARSSGVELEWNYRIGGFKFNAGLAAIDATYDSNTISQRVVRAGLCDDIVCAADGNVGGNDLPRSSDFQWNVGAQYNGSFGNGFGYFLRADLVGQSDQFVSELNTATIPERTLLNLRAGLNGEAWSAEFWVKNATDELYVSNAFYIPSPFFVDYVPTFGNQRRFGLALNYSF